MFGNIISIRAQIWWTFNIMRLREKIDADFEHKLLHTIRGIGYALKELP